MTELKTLKDIEFVGYVTQKEYANKYIKKELRQEIIKWIKELEKCSREDGSCMHDNDDHYYFGDREGGDALSQQECVACKDLLKHIFNITEEELE